MDPRAAELMPIHAARLALTRSVTQKAVDPSMGPALRVRALHHTDIAKLLRRLQHRTVEDSGAVRGEDGRQLGGWGHLLA